MVQAICGGEGGATMIVQRAGKYVVVSETTGRRFGTYDTLAEAKKRLRRSSSSST
jgi:hypothetical protein